MKDYTKITKTEKSYNISFFTLFIKTFRKFLLAIIFGPIFLYTGVKYLSSDPSAAEEWLLGIGGLVLGIRGILIPFLLPMRFKSILDNGLEAPATIIGSDETEKHNNFYEYSFTAQDGKLYKDSTNFGAKRDLQKAAKAGTVFTAIYDKRKPKYSLIKEEYL